MAVATTVHRGNYLLWWRGCPTATRLLRVVPRISAFEIGFCGCKARRTADCFVIDGGYPAFCFLEMTVFRHGWAGDLSGLNACPAIDVFASPTKARRGCPAQGRA